MNGVGNAEALGLLTVQRLEDTICAMIMRNLKDL